LSIDNLLLFDALLVRRQLSIGCCEEMYRFEPKQDLFAVRSWLHAWQAPVSSDEPPEVAVMKEAAN